MLLTCSSFSGCVSSNDSKDDESLFDGRFHRLVNRSETVRSFRWQFDIPKAIADVCMFADIDDKVCS